MSLAKSTPYFSHLESGVIYCVLKNYCVVVDAEVVPIRIGVGVGVGVGSVLVLMSVRISIISGDVVAVVVEVGIVLTIAPACCRRFEN